MKKSFQVFLCLLMVFTLISSTNAFAELTKDPEKFVQNVAKRVRHSIRSVRQISILSVVRGTVTLIAPRNISRLRGSLRSIFLGNDNRLKRRKAIKVKGTNNSRFVEVKGKGRTGRGYTFLFDSPSSINEFARNERFNVRSPGSIVINHSNSINTTFGFDIDRLGGRRKKNTGKLTGTFSAGPAKGRFSLNLSPR